MTSEAKRAVDEVAAARAKLDAHYELAQATTRQLNQELRQKAITAINDHGASKYAVACAARRSRTTVYQWLKAGESSGVQEGVRADLERREAQQFGTREGVRTDLERREAGESSGAQESGVKADWERLKAQREGVRADLERLKAQKSVTREGVRADLERLKAQKSVTREGVRADLERLKAQKSVTREGVRADLERLKAQKSVTREGVRADLERLKAQRDGVRADLERREAGESSGAQEGVRADWERREAKESSGAQESGVRADAVGQTFADRAKQDEFVACALALVDRFDDPGMTNREMKELLEGAAKDLGVQAGEMAKAVALARKVKSGLREASSDT